VSRVARYGLMVLAVVAAGAGYLWWSSPERQIRSALASVAEGLSHTAPETSLGAIAAASRLRPFLAPDVTIEPGAPFGAFKGRDAALAAASRLKSAAPAIQFELVDIRISLAEGDESATIDCTAMITITDGAGQQSLDAREVIMGMRDVDGRWVIAHARAVEVLEPVTR
jgi:hypothetical protein